MSDMLPAAPAAPAGLPAQLPRPRLDIPGRSTMDKRQLVEAIARTGAGERLRRDANRMNGHRALGRCLSMIFSENRCALFRIML